MRLAHQMAIESDLVRADMVEASEFPHLANRYEVMSVPKTVVNNRINLVGGLPEPQFLDGVMQAVGSAP